MLSADKSHGALHADIAHPINTTCREMIQARVVDEFYQELERSKQPGYISRYDDIDLDTPEPHFDVSATEMPRSNERGFGDGIL